MALLEGCSMWVADVRPWVFVDDADVGSMADRRFFRSCTSCMLKVPV